MVSKKIKLTIDNREIVAEQGTTILEAAIKNGIYIPHICYNKDLDPVGACRLCMVEIEGRARTIACRTPVEKGLNVKTKSPEINKIRQVVLELLLANHHIECLDCAQGKPCAIANLAAYVVLQRHFSSRI